MVRDTTSEGKHHLDRIQQVENVIITIHRRQYSSIKEPDYGTIPISARPMGHTTTLNEMLSDMPSETHVPLEEFSVTEIDYNPTSNKVSRSGESQALRTPRLSQASIQAKGVAPNKSTVTAGTS